jgi:hypothetical protein
MTVPRERFRALRLAREWLAAVVQDPAVADDARAEAERLLASYPPDEQIRGLIDAKAVGLLVDMAEALGAASRWIHDFPQETSDPTALRIVRRHLPAAGEILGMARRDPDTPSLERHAPTSLHHWLEPDEDYVRAVVKGWLDDCAVAVAPEWAHVQSAEALEDVRPWYLIGFSTSGIRYKDLAVDQHVTCTVCHPWTEAEERRPWKYVQHVTLPSAG